MGKIVGFIPVRGGSKSIPFKNIKSFCGKPLVYWMIEALHNCNEVSNIVVATDSIEIEDVVNKFNLPKVSIYRRSIENASDTASTESVMLEYINSENSVLKEDDIFILAQATSPLTHYNDVNNAINLFLSNKYDSVLSCVRYKRFFWNNDGSSKNYNYLSRPRRQDFEGELMENGALYINKVSNILKYKNRLYGKIGIYEMPEFTSIEIDEEDDWIIAEKLMKKHLLSLERKKIKLFVSDVDGVLTDAGMYYSEHGDEMKKFNTKDGMAFQLLRDRNIKTAIITSEQTDIVTNRAKKLKIDFLSQGVYGKEKLNALIKICEKENITLSEVAYIGDDINCKEILESVGLKACPNDAINIIKDIDGIIHLKLNGGQGCVREFVDNYIL